MTKKVEKVEQDRGAYGREQWQNGYDYGRNEVKAERLPFWVTGVVGAIALVFGFAMGHTEGKELRGEKARYIRCRSRSEVELAYYHCVDKGSRDAYGRVLVRAFDRTDGTYKYVTPSETNDEEVPWSAGAWEAASDAAVREQIEKGRAR